MAAFDRIFSGIPEMDTALDNIRLGNNVVWRVSKFEEFGLFMEPYIEQAIKDKRNIIYFRCSSSRDEWGLPRPSRAYLRRFRT